MRPTWAALSYLQDVMYRILGSIRRDFWSHLYNVAQINPCGRAGKSGNKRRSSTLRACSSHTWCPFSWDHPTLEAFWDLHSSPPHPSLPGQGPAAMPTWGVGSLHLGPVQPMGGRGAVRMHASAAVRDALCLVGSEGSATCGLLPGGSNGSSPWLHPTLAGRPRRGPHCAEHTGVLGAPPVPVQCLVPTLCPGCQLLTWKVGSLDFLGLWCLTGLANGKLDLRAEAGGVGG